MKAPHITAVLTNYKLSERETETDGEIGQDNATFVTASTRDRCAGSNLGDTAGDDKTGSNDADTTRVSNTNGWDAGQIMKSKERRKE